MDADELRSIPLFSDLDDAQRATIAHRMEQIDVELGTVIARQGDFAYKLFVVQRGIAAVTVDDELLTTLASGDCFGEIGVLEKGRRTANVVAITPMQLVAMVVWDFSDVSREIPALAERIQRLAESHLSSARAL